MTILEQVQTTKPPPGWVNRLMSWLVRSPFWRLADRWSILLLTVHGRRTGRSYTFPVQYLEEGDELWIFTSGRETKSWWRNLVGGAPVEVLLRHRRRLGRGVAFSHDVQPEVVEEGVRRYAARFPSMAKRMSLQPGDREALARVAERSVMVRIRLDG